MEIYVSFFFTKLLSLISTSLRSYASCGFWIREETL